MSKYQNDHYALQPIVNLTTGTTLYTEMLVRFADGRNVQEAILDAENARTIHEIDFSVLRQAASIIKRTPVNQLLAVNISPVTIEMHYDDLRKMIQKLGINAGRLVIEVTETAPILQPLTIAAFTISMQKAGIKVALDDYGSGFCDASRALFVKPDFIKVAKSGRNGWANMLGKEWNALREFARMASSQLVGEGVETLQDLRQVTKMGFKFGQGFHFNDRQEHIPAKRAAQSGQVTAPCF